MTHSTRSLYCCTFIVFLSVALGLSLAAVAILSMRLNGTRVFYSSSRRVTDL
jgi:hypothetical protein